MPPDQTLSHLTHLITRDMPFYRFSIDTPLSPGEAMARLRLLIHERKHSGLLEAFEDEMLRKKNDVTPFVGQIEGGSFRVRRDEWKYLSVNPIIQGVVLPAQSGSRIRITLLPNSIVAIGLLGWAGILLTWFVHALADALSGGGPPYTTLLAPIAIAILIPSRSIFYDAYDIRRTFVAATSANV